MSGVVIIGSSQRVALLLERRAVHYRPSPQRPPASRRGRGGGRHPWCRALWRRPVRHQGWAYQPVADGEPTHFGCGRCGAYGTRWFGCVERACRPARSTKRRRQRDVMLEVKEPTHPHRPFFAARCITIWEADWLIGKEEMKGGTPSFRTDAAGHPPP